MPEPTPQDQAAPDTRHTQIRRTAIGVALAAAAAGIIVGAMIWAAFTSAYDGTRIPGDDELVTPNPSVVVDADGDTIDTFQPAAVQGHVALDDLPDHVAAAVIAAEDRRFYEHPGFSVPDIARAFWANLSAGQTVQGASTITQQYVSLAVADVERTHAGKFREVAYAARIDREFSKDQILEAYLNSVPFGRTAHGIEAGAQVYFGVSAEELSVHQAAMLAGIIAAPTRFDPWDNPEGAADRRDYALRGMVEIGAISAAEAAEHLGGELPELRDAPLHAPGIEGYVLDQVRRDLADLLDDPSIDPALDLVIHTTLDSDAQAMAVEALNDELAETGYAGALVTIDPGNGAVRAMVGGLSYADQQFNVVTQAQRQVGSAFKPFVLAELVAQGYDPDDTLVDAPAEYHIDDDGNEVDEDDPDYATTITNFSDEDEGEITVREATVRSINTAYIRVGRALDFGRVAEMAERLGAARDLPAFPSIALGAADIRPIDLATAYTTLAAGGERHVPYLVERVETHDGDVLYEHESDSEQVIEEEVAAVVTDVLQDVITDGTGTAADIGRPAAGKTGTTNDFRDAWFAGYTPQATTVVWVGNVDNTSMGEVTGGSYPAAIWGTYMRALHDGMDVEDLPSMPDDWDLDPLEGLEARDPDDDREDDEDEDDEDDEDEDDDEEDDDEEDEDEDDDEDDDDDEEEDDD